MNPRNDACDRIALFAREGRLIQRAWRRTAADGRELRPGHRQAGGGDARDLVGDGEPAEMARRVGRAVAQDVPGPAAEPDHDAGNATQDNKGEALFGVIPVGVILGCVL